MNFHVDTNWKKSGSIWNRKKKLKLKHFMQGGTFYVCMAHQANTIFVTHN